MPHHCRILGTRPRPVVNPSGWFHLLPVVWRTLSACARQLLVLVQGEGCGVWQHNSCVGISTGAGILPQRFFCESCTVARADPYWRVVASHALMSPARLMGCLHPGMLGSSPPPQALQSVERIFMLASTHTDALRRAPDHQLQVAVIAVLDCLPTSTMTVHAHVIVDDPAITTKVYLHIGRSVFAG